MNFVSWLVTPHSNVKSEEQRIEIHVLLNILLAILVAYTCGAVIIVHLRVYETQLHRFIGGIFNSAICFIALRSRSPKWAIRLLWIPWLLGTYYRLNIYCRLQMIETFATNYLSSMAAYLTCMALFLPSVETLFHICFQLGFTALWLSDVFPQVPASEHADIFQNLLTIDIVMAFVLVSVTKQKDLLREQRNVVADAHARAVALEQLKVRIELCCRVFNPLVCQFRLGFSEQ